MIRPPDRNRRHGDLGLGPQVLLDQFGEVHPVKLVTGEDEHEAGALLWREQAKRVEGEALPFPAGEAAGQKQDKPRVALKAPGLAQGLHARRCNGLGRKGGAVHAARNGDDTGRVDLVHLRHMCGDPLRIGDHEIALRHDGIVGFLETGGSGIGAVISCDERHAFGLCSGPGAPRWRAGAGVHEVDFFLADDLAELTFVELDGDRVAGLGIHAEEFAAKAGEFRLEAAALAREERASTCLDDGFGHLEDRALDTARRQLRRDLKDRLAF